MDVYIAWYMLVGVLLVGYAILDGFDLGVGILHLFSRGNHERRLMMNSIGPVWDGNEVWLITAGGALFAAFPDVYATGFSTFYLPFMLLLAALIFRAVSMEFRGKEDTKRWRRNWDIAFSMGSGMAAFLFGLAIGNVILGMPIGADKEFAGSLRDLLSPYALAVGVLTVVMFALHGGLYLIIKTEGELQAKVKKWSMNAFWLFILVYAVVTAFTLYLRPEMMANFSFGRMASLSANSHVWINEHSLWISTFVWCLVLLNILAMVNIPRCIKKGLVLQALFHPPV